MSAHGRERNKHYHSDDCLASSLVSAAEEGVPIENDPHMPPAQQQAGSTIHCNHRVNSSQFSFFFELANVLFPDHAEKT
jgi:hypothetical protein